MGKYDIAAYVWPAFTGKESRARIFWPEGNGEWQTVMNYEQNSANKPASYSWGRKPLWGPVDEADPAVMEKQIDTAVSHGVNVFIYDWYWFDHRPFLEQCLDDGFLKAPNRGKMSFYLMWANHNANYVWDIRLSDTTWQNDCTVWDGAVSFGDFKIIVSRVINKYFLQPNYYKICGKPVFMIYDVENLIRGLGGLENTVNALRYFREETVRAGFPGLELQLTSWGERVSNLSGVDNGHTFTTRDLTQKLSFDSLTNYQFVHFCDMNRNYDDILRDVENEWRRMESSYEIPYYPHVSVGWDNNPRFMNFVPNVCRENTPAAFEKALYMAKNYIDTHALPAPLITVNSWNEWTETSYLEPDNVNGFGYLEAIKRVFLSRTTTSA